MTRDTPLLTCWVYLDEVTVLSANIDTVIPIPRARHGLVTSTANNDLRIIRDFFCFCALLYLVGIAFHIGRMDGVYDGLTSVQAADGPHVHESTTDDIAETLHSICNLFFPRNELQ